MKPLKEGPKDLTDFLEPFSSPRIKIFQNERYCWNARNAFLAVESYLVFHCSEIQPYVIFSLPLQNGTLRHRARSHLLSLHA